MKLNMNKIVVCLVMFLFGVAGIANADEKEGANGFPKIMVNNSTEFPFVVTLKGKTGTPYSKRYMPGKKELISGPNIGANGSEIKFDIDDATVSPASKKVVTEKLDWSNPGKRTFAQNVIVKEKRYDFFVEVKMDSAGPTVTLTQKCTLYCE